MHREELGRVLRFGITGTGLAALYVVIFLAASAAGTPPFWANLAAFGTAIVVQYLVQTLWTFRRPLADRQQMVRFGIGVSFGMIVSTALTTYIAPAFHWPDWLTAGTVAIALPITNYLVFRFFVYRIGRAPEDRP